MHFHSGTAEIEAEVRLFGATTLAPGSSTCARLVLRQPALLLPGDRFIIRMFSPVITIGGGVVIEAAVRAYSRKDNPISRLEALERADAAGRVAILVGESAWGIDAAGLVARTGLTEAEVVAAAQGSHTVAASGQHWYLNRERFTAMRREIVGILGEFHKSQPLLAGMAKADLAAKMNPRNPPPFLLDELLKAPEIAVAGETVRLRTHRVVLKEDEEKARGAIERAFEASGLAVPAVNDVLAKSGVEASRARTLMQILLKERRLIRAGAELVFHHTAIAELRRLLAAHKGERFGVPTFKEWTGISRKYAIPLLEFLDREHVTRREGDLRVVI